MNKEGGEKMGRTPWGVYNPGDTARRVVEAYLAGNTEEWTEKYREGVNEYKGDAEKQAAAIAKLTTWYTVLGAKRAEIMRAFVEIRSDYKNRLAGVAARGVAPAPI